MQSKTLSCWALGILFIVAGANHFVSPGFYETIMPPFLPWPMALIYTSGVAEILGGLGILIPWSRRFSGWGLIALLIAVFPANIYATQRGIHGNALILALLILRLPFQAVLIAWVYKSCIAIAQVPSVSNSQNE
jgi:uncharacterized membrane protein